MKYCIKCITFKDESEFSWRNRAKGWLKSRCIPCNREYDKEYHPKRSEASKTKKRQVQKQRIDEVVEKLVLYLLDHPCVDCGEPDIRCLDFDHLMDKKFNISKMISFNSLTTWQKISEEIIKCEVRCANCHRKVTHRRLNSRKQRWFEKYQSHLLTIHDKMLQSTNGMGTNKEQA